MAASGAAFKYIRKNLIPNYNQPKPVYRNQTFYFLFDENYHLTKNDQGLLELYIEKIKEYKLSKHTNILNWSTVSSKCKKLIFIQWFLNSSVYRWYPHKTSIIPTVSNATFCDAHVTQTQHSVDVHFGNYSITEIHLEWNKHVTTRLFTVVAYN